MDPITTKSWVYLFSKFTHEAMLFEALALFLGVFGYAVFYLIRKRKYGVAGKEISSNVVKVYLAQLVADAEEMRTQLFGLLGKGEASAKLLAGLQFQAAAPMPELPTGASANPAPAPSAAAGGAAPDPQLGEKLKELEKKLAEQASALDAVLNEKMKLEEELANAKAGDKSGGADKSGALGERVKQLESQLAEYAIIEDDLANLKRLQKENKTLKQQLADAGIGAAPAPPAAPAAESPAAAAPAAPAPAAPDFDTKTPKEEPAPAAAAPETPDLASATASKPAPATAPADAAPAPAAATPEVPNLDTKAEATPATATPDLSGPTEPNIATEEVAKTAPDTTNAADFEALVDVVEKNLAETANSGTMEPNKEAEAPDFKLEPGPAAETKPDEKSEEQLQADFEKMLNS